jgi:putative transferase (TIGR04331 family)
MTKVETLLVTTPIPETAVNNNKEKIIFLGEWCRSHTVQTSIGKSFPVVDYHLKDRAKFEQNNQYIQEFYERLIESFVVLLNQYHQVDKDIKYWRIILGPWLITYISSVWDHWESLRVAFERYTFDTTILLNSDIIESFAPDNHSHANYLISHSDTWNYFSFLNILQSEYSEKIQFKHGISPKSNDLSYKSKKISYKQYFASLADKFIGYFNNNQKILFFNTYFSYFDFIKICLKNLTIPRLNHEFNEFIEISSELKRNNLQLSFDAKNRFELHVLNNIIKNMPISYLEGYSEILHKVKDVSKKCEVIFTSNAHWSNDNFKIFCAHKTELKVKLIIASHGGSIPLKYTDDSMFVNKVADIFAVWHFPFSERQVRVQPHISSLRKKIKRNGQNLTIFSLKKSRYLRTFQSNIESSLIMEDYCQKKEFINNLDSNVIRKTKLRVFDELGWKLKQRYANDFPFINIESSESFIQALSCSKIIVCTYPETTFFEALQSGIPTILIYKKEYYEFQPAFSKLVKYLEDSKIMFSNPDDASNHINMIWSNPEFWWNQKNVVLAREMFFEYCGAIDENWLDDWTSIFQQALTKKSCKA